MSAFISAPLQMVELVAALRLPSVSHRRLQVLMDRNNAGQLTADERNELDSLVEFSESLSLMRADAIQALGRHLA